jgi:hypothetical protein
LQAIIIYAGCLTIQDAVLTISKVMRKNSEPFKRTLVGAFSLVLTFTLASILPANATSIVVPNFSFENPQLTPGANNNGGNGNTTSITSWTISAAPSNTNNGVYHPVSGFTSTDPLPAPADANQVVYMVPGAGFTSSITTTNSLGLIAANTTYMLTVALGNRSDTMSLTFDNGLYTIDLLANGVSVAENTLAGSAVAHGTFVDLSTSFLSTLPLVGESLTVRLSAKGDVNQVGAMDNNEGIFDNVRLTATTAAAPAPDAGSTALLLGGAVAAMGIACRKLKH